MSTAVTFGTVVEMFHRLGTLYATNPKPLLLRKKDGAYLPLSYAEVRDDVERFALGLASLGIGRGDRVAILSENRPEWVVTDIATLALGAVDVPIFPSQTAKQIAYILSDSGADVIVVSNAFQLSKVRKIRDEVPSLRHVIVMQPPPDAVDARAFADVLAAGEAARGSHADFWERATAGVAPADLCTIIYTSGTTGDPKGVMLTHGNFSSNIAAASRVLTIEPGDCFLSFLPLCHSFERMGGYYLAMACGTTIAYAESFETIAENLLEVRPTIIASVPRLFERMYLRIARRVEKEPPLRRRIFAWGVGIGRRYRAALRRRRVPLALRVEHGIADRLVLAKLRARTGGRIRFFVSGGAALARELGEFFEAAGIPIIEGYGLTETAPVIAVNGLEDYKFGSVGRPVPGVDVRIADDGEILVRGPNVMPGYWNNRKATREIIDHDGWLHTGDIGTMDAAGYLYITDRKKHLFVSSGGKNIAPQPIENLFAGSEYIEQFILIGDRRHYLTALVVPDRQALRAYADGHGILYESDADLLHNAEILRMIEAHIKSKQLDLANYERIRRFTLLEHPLTIENGGLTPTLKIKRQVVEERFHELIEAMYGGK